MNACYVYRLFDRLNGKLYLGVRYAKNCAPEELGVSYFTSSKRVEPLFRSNPSRFDKQIIVTGDKEFVIKVEKTLIDLYDAVNSDEFYNRTNNKAIHPDDCAKGASKVGKSWGPKRVEIQRSTGTGLYGLTVEQRSIFGRAAGLKGGNSNSKSGHMSNLGKTYCGVGGSFGGKVTGLKHKESGFIEKLAQINNSKRFKCLECGLISTPSGVGRHQQTSSHLGREEV